MSANEKSPIVVVGAGYVGLVTAASLAQVRHVRLVDKDPELVAALKAGAMPVSEPGLSERFRGARKADHLALFGSISEAMQDGAPRIVVVAVDTPTDNGADGAADLSSVYSVINDLLGYTGVAVVMKSTVPPRTGAGIVDHARKAGSDLTYLSCPEFLQEGRAIESLDNPDRIVIGVDDVASRWASEEIKALHEGMYRLAGRDPRDLPCIEMDLTSAELVKHASNLHLALRISYANEIANLSEQVGADIQAVMDAVGRDSRIGGDFLDAGIGFGGSCFGKDVKALLGVASEHDVDLLLATATLAANEHQVRRTTLKLKQHLGTLQGARVSILGLAFKPKTDDLRGSPAFTLAGRLRDEGATLSAWDPEPGARRRAVMNGANGRTEGLQVSEIAESVIHALKGADAVVLVTDWEEFAQIDWSEAADAMDGRLVVDGRNHLVPAEVRAAGLVYEGTGRESSGLRPS